MVEISHRLHQVLDGAPLSLAFTAEGSFSLSLTSVGTGQYTIALADSPYDQQTWQDSTQHWFHMIAEYWDGHPMYFGLIADKSFDFTTEVLTLDTVTVDDLFENRFTFGVGTYAAGDFSITSQTMRAALLQAIQRGTSWGGNWGLPLVYKTPLVEAGGFTQAWRNYDWKTIGDIRRVIQKLDDGPDIAFIPRVDGNLVAFWDVYAGDPRISGPTIDLPLSVKKSHARNVRVREQGRGMLSGAFVKGEGGGKGRLFGEAGFIGGPTMAVRDSARDMVSESANLNNYALAELKKKRKPIEQWEFDLVIGETDNPFPIEDFRLGTRLNLKHSGNAYRPAEEKPQYLVKFTHSTRDRDIVSPEVQPA